MTTQIDLSELQLSLLRALWDRGEATAAQVQHALRSSRPLAITTVQTLLARLEKRGVVRHRSEGRGFIYRARVTERDVRRRMLSGLVANLFRGEPSEVVEQLLSHRDVSDGDIARIEELLRENKRADGKKAREGRKGGR